MHSISWAGSLMFVKISSSEVDNSARWTHEHFPDSGCVISIEFKKFFMDEWTGVPDSVQLEAIQQSLQSTVPGVLAALKTI